MNAKYTPGPWFSAFDHPSDSAAYVRHGFSEVAILFGEKEQRDANAALVACAPEMLNALIVAQEHVCGALCPSVWKTADGRTHCEDCARLRLLITRASGGAQS